MRPDVSLMSKLDDVGYTVGVFQDVEWADRGLEALARHGFPAEAISVMAKESQTAIALIKKTFGTEGRSFDVRGIGTVVAHGTLIEKLQGDEEGLERVGVARSIGRAGFQTHDGFIFENLTAKGGVLVAIHTEARAADALSVLHSYGGGNAAIGAWKGRV